MYYTSWRELKNCVERKTARTKRGLEACVIDTLETSSLQNPFLVLASYQTAIRVYIVIYYARCIMRALACVARPDVKMLYGGQSMHHPLGRYLDH